MKRKNVILLVVFASLAVAIGWFISSNQKLSFYQTNGHKDIWYCPMHPWIKSNKPGICPICLMKLVKKRGNQWIELQQQISESQEESQQRSNISVEGYTTISVPAEKRQLIGVRTAVVTQKTVIKTIRAAGEYKSGVYAQIFENDLEYIKVGQKAIVEVPAHHQHYEGEVISIDSNVDETSRTTRVHIWIKPANQQPKSNMFVNVEFPVKLGKGIVVPREAVMDTGIRKIVFVQKGRGIFKPRDIQTGWETDDGFEVKSGLKTGERVVISGNFLLDSESRLQATLQEGDSHGQ